MAWQRAILSGEDINFSILGMAPNSMISKMFASAIIIIMNYISIKK